MPRIIKKGKRKEKKVVCHECGTTVGYFKEEVKEYSGTDYGGGPDGRTWIVCPHCKEDITLTSW